MIPSPPVWAVNPLTFEQARKCAALAPKAGVIMEALILLEIIYYSFEIWKNCHAQTATASEGPVLHSSAGQKRRAERIVRRQAARKNVEVTDMWVTTQTDHMLSYVTTCSDDVVTACCNETFSGINE